MDTEALAALLNRAAVLPGRVEAAGIEVRDTGAFNSSTVRLRVRTAGSPTPVALVLKRPTDVAWSIAAAATEARFYRLVAGAADHPVVVPRCLTIGPDDDPYVLLDDLSATHRQPTSRDRIVAATGLPDPADQIAVIDCLARLQAYWWEHPAQGTGALERGFWSADGEGFDHFARRRRTAWQVLRRDHGGWLPAAAVERCQRVCDGLPAYGERWLLPRVAAHRRLTLLHGDAYFSNFLCPIDGTGPAIMIDWQSACFDIGAFDLVNLIATFWNRDQRRDHIGSGGCWPTSTPGSLNMG